MSNEELALAVATLSARVMALETLVHTLALHVPLDRSAARSTYGEMSSYVENRCVEHGLDPATFAHLRASFAEFGAVLEPGFTAP